MLMIISLIIIISTSFYCLGVFLLYWAWNKIPTSDTQSGSLTDEIFVSIILPVRNEAKNINLLLQDLLEQDFPKKNFEVVIINDHSEDTTLDKIISFSNEYLKEESMGDWLIVSSLDSEWGKKQALYKGILLAKGNLIITTDGDVRLSKKWISTIVAFYQEKGAKFISAPVALDLPQNVFEKMQVIEFGSLVGTGAGTLFWGLPTMCNGANIAFEKAVFEEVRGYEGNWHIASGDDEFLMQKVFQKYPQSVFFLKSKDAIVRTTPQTSWKDFYSQRKRWASKWKIHQSIHIKLIALLIFGYHCLNICAFFFLILDYQIILIHFILKFSLEFVFLRDIHRFLNKGRYWSYFIYVFLSYSFYVVYIGLFANIKGYDWKGRKLA